MPWVRLDDGFADHPKVEKAGPLAAWLHVAALCYCARHLTDGRIPVTKARRLTDIPSPTKHIAALLEAGLWHEDGDDYIIHDYLEYQPSRADVEKDRGAARERMASKRRRTDGTFAGSSPEHSTNNGRTSHGTSPELPDSFVHPIPTRPDPSLNDARGLQDATPALSLVPDPAPPSAAEVATQRFEDHLWPTYPKRNGKRLGKAKALAQWKRLSVDDQRAAVKGARNYAAACATGLTMAKDPERWLRDRCWDDWQDPATPDRPVDGPAAGAFPEASARW